MNPVAQVNLFEAINASPFASSFFSQLLATLIVVLIGSVIIPPIIRWQQRAKLNFYKEGSWRSKKFKLTESADGQWEATIQLVVGNRGTKTIERFYWDMYMEKDFTLEVAEQTPPFPRYFTTHEETSGKYRHRYGYMEMPIFPLDNIHFTHELKIKVKERRKITIYYFFRTDLGESPVWSWIALTLKKVGWLKSFTVE